ncbi:MAG: signal recognition particle receptor subunit alpha, partial [Candidatus Lambdaproteobacteria bacterium]|nr:signal recognition particle receptor subunit alpha [Candidatus Lambdaproteobacteria bacterium]
MASRKDQRREKKRRATAERTERAAQAMHAGQRRLARGHAQPEPEPTAQQRELEARFAQAHEQAQRERLARQQGAREREERGRLHRATEQARAAQHALTAAEEARRARAGLLQKELRPAEAPEPASEGGWRERLRRGFAKTREGLASGLGRILLGRKEIDPALLPDIEEVLLAADVGPLTTARLLRAVEQRLRRHELADGEALREALKAEIAALMERAQARLEQVGGADGDDLARHKPAVILFVGVNGTGKTTTIGKLAAQHAAQGKRVLLIAGDTFRAAAAEQLGRWAERTGATLFAKHAGADPSGVIYQ